MTLVRRSLYLLLCLVGTAAWSLLVYGFGSRWVSQDAGALLAAGVSLSVLAYLLSSHLQEERLTKLLAGVCPGCRGHVDLEHRHRYWDPATQTWPSPSTSWQCRSCSYSHTESWACPSCPLRGS